MAEKQVWVVRAGVNNEIATEVERAGVVAIGWDALGDLSKYPDRGALKEALRQSYPGEWSDSAINVTAGQLQRFVRDIGAGDYVLTPIKATREVLVGTATGPYRYDKSIIHSEYPNVRAVSWNERKISRDELRPDFRNSIGSSLTLFSLTPHREVLEAIIAGQPPPKEAEVAPPFYEETKAKAEESIRDCLTRLDGFEFERLVAAVLTAAGYNARVTPPGPDRGVDIVAQPDRFGFREPVIKVQVKHRKQSMGANEVSSFKGRLHANDCGLFVSTGGFTREAQMVPELAPLPRLKLMDGDQFVEMLLDHYEDLDPATRAMVPLRKLYLPYKEEE